MKLFGIIMAATAAEASFAGAVFGLLSLAGGWNGWLDVLAQFAPVWLSLSVAGAVLAWLSLEPGLDRIVVLAVAAIGVMANAALVAPEFVPARSTVADGVAMAAPLKVLTFNTWRDNYYPDGTVRAILRADADIVALQEIDAFGPGQIARLKATYPYWAGCDPLACDIVLLSKQPWKASDLRAFSAADDLTVALGETVAPDGRPVWVMTTHYARPVPPDHQAAQRLALADFVTNFDKSDLILTGDFNLTPWTAAMREQDAALSPLVRRTRGVFTWPATIAMPRRPAPFAVLPIDHIYAGPAWRTQAVSRLSRTPSDHYGVMAILARAAG